MYPKFKVPKWKKLYLQYEKEAMEERTGMSAISPLQMAVLRSQGAKTGAQRDEDYQFFKSRHWSKDQKEQILKAKEERRMTTEIKIVKGHRGTSCDYPTQWGCNKKAKLWRTSCGDVILAACKEHGEPLIQMLVRSISAHGGIITITGGYDEPKPKSKLVATRDSISQATPFAGKYALEAILEHLIEKEQSDDSS